jgi:hypothetical protein
MDTQTLASDPGFDTDESLAREAAPGGRTPFLRRVVSLLVGLGLVFGIVLTATPASAAGGTAPDIYFCMKYNTGAAYANAPVYLYKNGVKVKDGRTNAAGCATWVDVSGNANYYVQGYWAYTIGWSGYAWNGYTKQYWVPNVDTTYGFGTGWLSHYQLY